MNARLSRLDEFVRRTPLLELGPSLYGKAENLQTRGSYKIRGVVNVLRNRSPAELRRGVSTISAGNLGQTLAHCARELEIPCRVYVPDSAPRVKKDAIRSFGAELVELPFREIWEMVRTVPRDPEYYLVHPCFDADLRRGYASIAHEILEDLPKVDTVIIPYGLGSLCLGVADVLKRLRPATKIFAAEVTGSAPVGRVLAGKPPTKMDRSGLVDAIGTPGVIPEIFNRVSPLLAGSIAVGEREVAAAIGELYGERGLVVEGAAAAAYAAAKILRTRVGTGAIACVLSGRNIDLDRFFGCLAEQFGGSASTDHYASAL